MTDQETVLRDLLAKGTDASVLHEMVGFAPERLMELEMTGAAHGERSPDWLAQRNENRDRDWETRAGTVELRIPKLRKGGSFPAFLEPYRMPAARTTSALMLQALTDRLRAGTGGRMIGTGRAALSWASDPGVVPTDTNSKMRIYFAVVSKGISTLTK